MVEEQYLQEILDIFLNGDFCDLDKSDLINIACYFENKARAVKQNGRIKERKS